MIFQYRFNNKFKKYDSLKILIANLNITTEYNATFSPKKLSGQEAWTQYKFTSLMVTVQIFKITDLFLRKVPPFWDIFQWQNFPGNLNTWPNKSSKCFFLLPFLQPKKNVQKSGYTGVVP